MKILHVVSLIDPEGSFGGPLRVALNQLSTLAANGHDVTLAAAARGYEGEPPTVYDGVPLKAFPAVTAVPGTGFAGITSPTLLAWLGKHARDYDVVHVHLARDLVSLPAAAVVRARGAAYVVQTHGMIDESDRKLATVLDAAMTRRVLRGASTVFALTSREVADLQTVAPGLKRVVVLHNGVPLTDLVADARSSREVLFLARIAKRKCPGEFVDAAQQVAATDADATFALVGPDEDALDEVKERLAVDDADGRIAYEGALAPAKTLDRMVQAGIYVLPAMDEPFGMTVFEAMSVGLPTIVRDDCGIADIVAQTGGVVVSDGDFAAAIRELLADPERRVRAGEAGRAYVREHANMEAVSGVLVEAYAAAGGGGR